MFQLISLLLACSADPAETSTTPDATSPSHTSGTSGATSNGTSGGTSGGTTGGTSSGAIPWIDTHAHPFGYETVCDTDACVEAVLETMDELGVARAILMSPPSPQAGMDASSEEAVREAVARAPDRFYLGVGGNILNGMIEGTDDGVVTAKVETAFNAAFDDLTADGEAVVLGEMAALHLSYSAEHAFEETTPDSGAFHLLAARAAAAGLPIDWHMDAVLDTMDTPRWYFDETDSDRNPEQLQANVASFEALMAANPTATFIWVHVGRDTTGDMSAELVGPMLAAHPNLYIQLAPNQGPLETDTAIFDADNQIRDEWLALLETWPDRAVLGSDLFMQASEEDARILGLEQLFLQQLPADLATAIGCDNAVRLYALPEGC